MSILSPANPVTAQELERISGHYELIQGELSPMSPSGGQHGLCTARLSHFVTAHVIGHALGECFSSECGFVVERDPDTVLAPDFAFIRSDRLPDPVPASYIPVAPDLVLETRSPGDSRREIADKVRRWLHFGVRVVWTMDPTARTFTVHRSVGAEIVLRAADTLEEPELLPGFALPLINVFR